MNFVLGGRLYSIKSLEPSIDQAFIDLSAAYLGKLPYSWTTFSDIAYTFFNSHPNDTSAHDDFFSNFYVIWNHFLTIGRFDICESIWQHALQPALAWESDNSGKHLHKGTVFYFWGMTVILKGDLDHGYALMHQALQEDIRTQSTALPDTPSLGIAALKYSKIDQAFLQWVINQARFLNQFIEMYANNYSRSFKLDDFKSKFLEAPPDADSVFLFAYTLARLMRLDTAPSYTLASGFASQLEMNLLFDITLVIDAAIKSKNTTPPRRPPFHYFSDHILFLSSQAGLSFDSIRLTELNKAYTNDFDSTLRSVIDGSFVFTDSTSLLGLDADMGVALGVRNQGAHNVLSVPTIWQRFPEIRQSILNVLFLTAETLY